MEGPIELAPAIKQSYTCWCSDELDMSCENGERVRVAFSLDCCDKYSMRLVATTKGMDTGLIGDLMMQAVENRFASILHPASPFNGSPMSAVTIRQPRIEA
jgi:putative transposase